MRRKIIVSLVILTLVTSFLVVFTINKVKAADAYADFYPTDDTFIYKPVPDSNQGWKDHMVTRNAYGAEGSDIYQDDILVRFDISSISLGTAIISATLNLYYYQYADNNPVGRELNLYRVTSDWDENTVTWDTQPSYASSPTTYSTVPSSYDWMSWDVSDDIQSYVNGENPNYGWKITDENYWGTGNIPITYFRTKEYGEFIPYLEVEFADVYVDDDAAPSWYDSNHVKTIQEGINNASVGETVYVYSGIYYENVEITKDSVKLVGEDKHSTVIDADMSGDGILISIPSNNIAISNFTIRNAEGCGIIFYDPVSGRNCKFNRVSDCIIHNNSVNENWKSGFGIHFGGHDAHMEDNRIINCEIYNNDASGIITYSSAYGQVIDNKILSCKVYNNGFEGWFSGSLSKAGISVAGSNGYNRNTIISQCEIYNNAGDGIFKPRGIKASGTQIYENFIYNNTLYAINISGSCNNDIIFHNNFINNGINEFDDGINTWYNETLQEGNYWDDYSGADTDGDGIGDTPYDIPGGSNQDRYPLGYFKHPPVANFTYAPPNPLNTDNVQFNDTSTDPDGIIVTWWWEFGDGYYSELQDPQHHYSKNGIYNVSLKIITENGFISVKYKTIYVTSVLADMNGDEKLNSGDVRYLAIYVASQGKHPDFSPLYP